MLRWELVSTDQKKSQGNNVVTDGITLHNQQSPTVTLQYFLSFSKADIPQNDWGTEHLRQC
jgi:hypothetical protein